VQPRQLSSGDAGGGDPPGWDPYIGDAKTGLGESDAVVKSPAGGRPPHRKADFDFGLEGKARHDQAKKNERVPKKNSFLKKHGL
jgi:hypothetical protein